MLISDYRENLKLIFIAPSFILPRLKYYREKSFEICLGSYVYFMSFIPYPHSIYNLDYDCVKELSNRISIQREEFRKNLDKLSAVRTSIKNLTKDNKNIVSLKYLCEYENTIKEIHE